MSTPDLTPLGRLLEGARLDILRISIREAARRAGMSEGYWRQIVRGVQRKGGLDIAVNPSARTVVAMASAVGAEPSEALQVAGIQHVSAESIAAMLEEIRRPAAIENEVGNLADDIERIRNLSGITPHDKLRMIKAIVDLHEERSTSAGGSSSASMG